jgi:F-type H+-transporting ATPase subunit epsilon
MARTLLCEIVTPERIVYHNEAQMVVAPAVDGEIGILPLHAPLVTLLKPGEIRVRLDDKEVDWIATAGGYLQVHEDKVIILADRAELASRIDVDRARTEKAAIEQRIASLPEKDEAALDELKWYEAQISVGSKVR